MDEKRNDWEMVAIITDLRSLRRLRRPGMHSRDGSGLGEAALFREETALPDFCKALQFVPQCSAAVVGPNELSAAFLLWRSSEAERPSLSSSFLLYPVIMSKNVCIYHTAGKEDVFQEFTSCVSSLGGFLLLFVFWFVFFCLFVVFCFVILLN